MYLLVFNDYPGVSGESVFFSNMAEMLPFSGLDGHDIREWNNFVWISPAPSTPDSLKKHGNMS